MIDARRIGIVHEQDVLRRGVAAYLGDEPSLLVVYAVAADPPNDAIDLAIVSKAAARQGFDCPVILLDEEVDRLPPQEEIEVAAMLSVRHLSAEQLIACVRAAATGLHVSIRSSPPRSAARLDERRVEILRLLAAGETTRSISTTLCYSERTIKSLIRDVEYELSASNRAQAVAEAIRQGLI
jgi:DNA-binding CsgD family transcriptional regulator